MDDQLVDYVLNQLTPTERAALEQHLVNHPDDAGKINRLRSTLHLLEADRNAFKPPVGLVVATLARTAQHIATERLQREPTPATKLRDKPTMRRVVTSGDWVFPNWRRIDVAVAAGIAFIAFGLVFGAIGKIRHTSQVYACQDQLRQLHVALTGYTDTHSGRYPEVGTQSVPVAGAFVTELARAGQYESFRPLLCPASDFDEAKPVTFPTNPTDALMKVGYSYSLGYRTSTGSITGLRRTESATGVTDGVPVVADLPSLRSAPTGGPYSPHGNGQNVLFAGGSVRYSTISAVGINRDEIYQNDNGFVRAGLHINDTALGRPSDYP